MARLLAGVCHVVRVKRARPVQGCPLVRPESVRPAFDARRDPGKDRKGINSMRLSEMENVIGLCVSSFGFECRYRVDELGERHFGPGIHWINIDHARGLQHGRIDPSSEPPATVAGRASMLLRIHYGLAQGRAVNDVLIQRYRFQGDDPPNAAGKRFNRTGR